MGFSLSGFLQGAENWLGLNHQQQAQPKPAPLPAQGQPGFGVVRPGAAVAPQPHFAPQQVAQMRNQPMPQQHTWQQSISNGVHQTLGGAGLGLAHSVVDGLQMGSGLYDLAGHVFNNTPSNTTSRFDKALQGTQNRLDATAKHVDPNGLGYQIGNAAGNVAQFLAPSAIAKGATMIPKVASAIDHAAPVINAAKNVVAPTTNLISKAMPGTDAVGRIAGAAAHGALSPSGLLNTAGATVYQAGREANQGQTVNKGTIARDFGQNEAFGTLLGAGGQAAREAGPALATGARNSAEAIKTAQNKAATNANIDAGIAQLSKQQRDLAAKINSAPLNATRGTESLQQHINILEGQKAQLNANRPQMSVMDRVLSGGPGLGMRAVTGHEDLTPQQHEFISQYAEMLKNMGQGNGVAITSDGRRISNNVRGVADKGKAMTNNDWFTRARQQIESGKAAYGASDEYKALSQPQPNEAPLQLPQGFDSVTSAKSAKASSSKAVAGPQSPAAPTGMKERGLTTGVKNSPEFSPQLQSQVNSKYQTFTDKAANQSTDKFMQQPLDEAQKQVMATLAENQGTHIKGASGNVGVTFGKQEVSNAGAVMKALDQAGRHDEATAIHDMLAAKLTNAGQTAQAASLIYNRTPAGLQNMANRTLKNAGVKASPELQAKMDTAMQQIKNTADGTKENDLARKQYDKIVGSAIPTKATTKALSLYKTGILSSPKTAVKVAMVQAPNAIAEHLTDAVAAPIDKAVSLVTGKRAVTAPGIESTKAAIKAVPGALQDAKTRFKDDIVMPNSSGIAGNELTANGPRAHGANFGVAKDGGRTKLDRATGGVSSKILNGYTSSIGRVHGAIQTVPYELRRAEALAQGAVAEAKNRGLTGVQRTQFINDFQAHPENYGAAGKRAVANADLAAQYDTNQQETALGRGASAIQRTMPGGQVIAPITRIPGAVATQVVNYSPAGFLKTGVQAVLDKRAGQAFDQAGFSRGMGRAVVGTALMGGGAALALQGRVSGGYPKDKATQQLWQSANIPANSVYVGGHAFPNEPWRNYGGTWQQISSPGGAPAQAALTGGAVIDGAHNGGVPGAIIGGTQGAAQIVTNQPYLTGVSGAMGAINTPNQAKSFLDQTAGSVVPNFIRDAATSTDPLQRQTSVQSPVTSMKNSITNGIPGLREHNQPQMDVFGNSLPRNNDPFTAAFNPLNPQSSHPSDLTAAMGAIHNTKDANNKPLPIPVADNKKIQYATTNGPKATLSDAQRTQYVKQSGSAAQAQMNNLIHTPAFTNATPAQQSKMLADIMSGNRNFTTNQLPNSAVKLTGPGKMVARGQTPAIDQTTGKVSTAANVTGSYKLSDGSTVIPKDLQTAYSKGTTYLTSSKKSGDFTGYMKTAQDQLANISKQLQDPNISDKKAQQLANEAQALHSDIYKYGSYGAFNKPKGVQTVKTLANSTINGARQDYVNNITRSAAKYGIDPNAAIAVAAAEGLGGGVGDNGTSFGPFQLHVGGMLPQGKNQQWAESAQGIDYAMQQIAKVAGGKSGSDAINAIVNGFENPADPTGEIQRALAVYSGGKVDLTNAPPGQGTVIASSNSSKGSKGSSGTGATMSKTIASFKGTYSNPYKFDKTLRGLAQHASLGKSSGSGKLKSYARAPHAKGYNVSMKGTARSKKLA